MRHRENLVYGRFAGGRSHSSARYDDAETQESASNHWSSSENNASNAWNVNFNSSNVNNNNKYNSNSVRPVAACADFPYLRDSVIDAYLDCLHHKRTSKQAVEYMSIAYVDLNVLAKEIYDRTYTIGVSTCFMVKYPKYREVFAASFRDRIVHHWICMRLNPLFEFEHARLGNVSHNCRKGFGSIYSIREVANAMRRISCNYRKEAWVYKGDMDSFYMRIPKPLLWQRLEAFINAKYDFHDKDLLLWLTKMVVFHSPEKNCILNSPPDMWRNLKPSKSLFRTDDDKGIPIGNLTTQLFANFYMAQMDEKAKELFSGLNYHYVRFVDDFVIICDDKKQMLQRVRTLEDYIEKELHLKVHKDKKYCQLVSHGVSYVGAFIKNGRTYLSSRTLARFKERIVGFNRILDKDVVTIFDLTRIECVVNSYLGFCVRHRTYRKRRKYICMFVPSFWKYFYVKGHYQSIHIKKKITKNYISA